MISVRSQRPLPLTNNIPTLKHNASGRRLTQTRGPCARFINKSKRLLGKRSIQAWNNMHETVVNYHTALIECITSCSGARHAPLPQITTLGLVVVKHESVKCDSVLVTYWSKVCRERTGGGGAAVPVTQGAFALADQSLLVPLHPLQLLISTHLPPLLLLLLLGRLPGVQTLQGTFWSLLRGVGGKRESW